MNVLFLTPHLPYPPNQGAKLRNYALIHAVASRYEVDLLTFGSPQLVASEIDHLRSFCRNVMLVAPPERSPHQRLRQALTSPLPDIAYRLASEPFAAALAEALANDYDVVQVEGIEMAPYLLQVAREERRPRLIFDEHNAEYALQRRIFQTDLRSPRRWVGALYSLLQWRRLVGYETRACAAADAVVAVSEQDAAALRRLRHGTTVTVVPNGIDTSRYTVVAHQGKPNLLFVGTLDYRPNVDAVLWCLNDILPRVRRAVPQVWLTLVGRSPAPQVQQVAAQREDVLLLPDVPDVRPYLAKASVCVVPMRMGSGVRLKVLEAMAAGVPIVSTTLGVSGLAVRPGEHALVADTAQAFADAIVALLRDRALRERLARSARALVEDWYDWRHITPRLLDLYDTLLAGSA